MVIDAGNAPMRHTNDAVRFPIIITADDAKESSRKKIIYDEKKTRKLRGRAATLAAD
jgi:hypothetical protein